MPEVDETSVPNIPKMFLICQKALESIWKCQKPPNTTQNLPNLPEFSKRSLSDTVIIENLRFTVQTKLGCKCMYRVFEYTTRVIF